MQTSTLLGLRTAIYAVSDVAKAKAWYSSVLAIAPYFDKPFYVGFNVGGFELGLHPEPSGPPSGPGGVTTYWGVESMARVWPRLLELGAAPVSPPRDVGDGIQVAVVKDPFGNSLGLIENPHFPNTA